MPLYCIIETDAEMTVVDHADNETAADAALRLGATVIDAGPYDSYEDALDALEALQGELLDDDEQSDVPGTQALEGRYETDD